MTSITKNIYNNPNISRRFKPADKSKYYIYKFELFSKSAIAFSKVAGGVGDKIFQYLDWKKEMNGRQFETLPESVFYGQWGIRRQRVAEALLKLEAAGLVVLQKEKGKKTRLKLATPRGQLNGK